MLIEPSKRNSVGIAIKGIDKFFGSLQVMKDVSLDIEPGKFVALLGPSGCGKTTLLRMIAGLAEPSRGAIRIGSQTVVDVSSGVLVPPQHRRLGMVFQHYALWPHMTVKQNICFPLRKQGVPKSEWEARIANVMEAVGLPTILDRRPAQLSGGQQQRVALARALVSQPSVLLLDEPLSNLDANLRDQLRRELRQLHDRQGTTTILVTHDQEEAAMLADTIAVMNSGSVVQTGSPREILERPANKFVATFVGYDNFIPSTVDGVSGDEVRLRLADDTWVVLNRCGMHHNPGQTAVVAAKSTQLQIVEPAVAANGRAPHFSGTVTGILNLGRWREIYVHHAGTTVTIRDRAEVRASIEPGRQVTITLAPDAPIIHD